MIMRIIYPSLNACHDAMHPFKLLIPLLIIFLVIISQGCSSNRLERNKIQGRILYESKDGNVIWAEEGDKWVRYQKDEYGVSVSRKNKLAEEWDYKFEEQYPNVVDEFVNTLAIEIGRTLSGKKSHSPKREGVKPFFDYTKEN